MAKDFDLNSRKWLALVFADKNHEYGAYVNRDESSDRHLKSILLVTTICLSVIFLPKLVKSIMPAESEIGKVTAIEMSTIDMNQEVPEDNQIKEINVPPPPELKATVQYTPPVIVEDEKIRDDDLMLTQQDLKDTTADISIQTVEGVEGGTVDIADLVDHKVIVEEPKKPEIYHHVEVSPQFPGGERAMMKWLQENIVYPTIAAEQGISGKVNIRFVVTPEGNVEQVEVIKGLDPSCDKEAVRAVKKMPRWTPGRQNGNPVYVYYNLPVSFQLQQ